MKRRFKVSFIVEAEFSRERPVVEAEEIVEEAVTAFVDNEITGREYKGQAGHGVTVKLTDFVNFTAEAE